MSLSALALLAATMTATQAPDLPMTQQDMMRAKRSAATHGNRLYKQAKHAEVLEAVGGGREALKTITVWMPRKSTQKLFARAFDKKACAEGGERFTDAEYEVEATEYDLEEIEVERARHPDEEVAFARLQRRFVEHKPSILGYFHKPSMKSGDRRARRVMPAPLGDFSWVERSEELSREQQISRSLATLRAQKPIRNVREAV